MHTETYRPSALPTIGGCELQAAGVDWDAVRAPRSIGIRALAILGNHSGAVIEDPCEPAVYWFVREGSTTGWEVPETRPLGVTQYLVVPPAHRVKGPGPHWRISPTDGRLITDVRALRTAIEAAVAPFRGP
ncbi:hypothetical protein [Streptomyces sp. NBC_01481]|uniref:hypothetical protein n=1 Tax=Streptomyces sp. NBC_01481 TaxID=2975869 RepID=UPI00225C3309|nr:hypothetical protein [Streptomyces sp. NBC_01481]MCX4588136.1 hypothetical protein [Streptomyces sp. NBC_01481]